MDESKNLLACPFCGGEVEHYYSGSSDWEFECKTQGCNAQVTFWVRGGDEPERARQLWNRRAGEMPCGCYDGGADPAGAMGLSEPGHQRLADRNLNRRRKMNEPEQNADTQDKASSLHEVGRRLGRFRVAFALMDEWPILLPAMGQVVVVRAECRYDSRTVDYVAYSHHFEVVAAGVEPPEYTATFTRHENGSVTVKWERAKDWRHESPTERTERQPPGATVADKKDL